MFSSNKIFHSIFFNQILFCIEMCIRDRYYLLNWYPLCYNIIYPGLRWTINLYKTDGKHKQIICNKMYFKLSTPANLNKRWTTKTELTYFTSELSMWIYELASSKMSTAITAVSPHPSELPQFIFMKRKPIATRSGVENHAKTSSYLLVAQKYLSHKTAYLNTPQ